jgi:hypothetical protein
MLIKRIYRHAALGAALGALVFLSGLPGSLALAYAPENDLMKVKGFSPEMIEITNGQRSRQEWKQAAPPRKSPAERFIHNVYYGEWINSIDEFGSNVMRDH